MVINNDPDYEKKRAAKDRLEEGEFARRRRLLDQFMDCSSSIIALAFMYAKNFEETGFDVTEKWVTAEQQADALQRYYDKGYQNGYGDGIQKGREYEREKIKRINEIASRSSADSIIRKSAVPGAYGNLLQSPNGKSSKKRSKHGNRR